MDKLLIWLILGIIISVFFLKKIEKFNCMTCDRNRVWSYRNRYSKIEDDCRNCNNCGVCVDKYGNRRCKIGNNRGPLFAADCKYWYHKPNNFWLTYFDY